MPDIGNAEASVSIPKAVVQIRKPEMRSAYSDALTTSMQNYLTEVFDQPQPSEAATELKQRHGLVLFEGSLLRGTATEKTHDVDIFVMTDERPIDPDLSQRLAIFTRDVEDHHPEKMPFSDYLMHHLQSGAETTPLYNDRIAELQRRKDYIDKKYARSPGPVKIESTHFVHVDTQFDSLGNFINAIKVGDVNILSQNETPSRIIVSILTATPDLVYEAVPGSLSYHQMRIVEALAKLQTSDPKKFNVFYDQLDKDFANLHRSTSWRYPDRDFRLLSEYYLRSGRFVPKYIAETNLINMVTRRLTKATIADEFQDSVKHDDYKNKKDKLLDLMTQKHGVETGLAREELEKIARGDKLLDPDEADLSPEALRELEDFEKRIKILVAFRKQIKLPSLDEFKQAYLVEKED